MGATDMPGLVGGSVVVQAGEPRVPSGGALTRSADRPRETTMSEVLRERQGHIEILTINRPEARNAINGAVATAFRDAFDELENDDDAGSWCSTGSGRQGVLAPAWT